MNQEKIGEFLKELRNQKKITQEQLAEQFNVSRRTVSRWETGFNMPDISVLIELAEYYEVSIPEIIEGERKSEKMNEEVKEMALKLSEYAEQIDRRNRGKYFWLTVAALIGMFVFIFIQATGLISTDSIYEEISSAVMGLTLGILVILAIYLSGLSGKVKAEKKLNVNRKNYTFITQVVMGVLFCAMGFFFVVLHLNHTSGYIFICSGILTLAYSSIKHFLYK